MDNPELPDSGDMLPHNPASDTVSEADKLAINTEREASQEGWEKVADEANDLRPVLDKVLKRNIIAPDDVMHDEALKANAMVDQSVESRTEFDRRSADAVKSGEEPWSEDNAWGGKTPQEAYEKLKKDERDMGRTGEHFTKIPVFNPNQDHTRRAGYSIRERENKIRPITAKVSELLQQQNVLGAEEALQEIRDIYLADDKNLTVKEHLDPSLRGLMVHAFRRNDPQIIGELLDSSLLSQYIGENMTQDAGITKEQRQTKEMLWVIEKRAIDAIKELVPILWEHEHGRFPENELKSRINTLAKVGIMTKDEMRDDWLISRAVIEVLAERMAEDAVRGAKLHFPYEGWKLEALGLVDREEFIRDPKVIRAATLSLVEHSPEVEQEALQALETVFLRREKLPEDAAGSVKTKTAVLEAMAAQEEEIKELPSTNDLSIDQLSKALSGGQEVTLEYNLGSQDWPGRAERSYNLKANTLEELTNLINARIGLESDSTVIKDGVVKTSDGKQITIDALMGLN